jgi:Lrp/AsnC family transcriptional regulator for asnA, asnC and gidA
MELVRITFINTGLFNIDCMHKFDELDMRILSELTKDASISVPRLSKKLNVNASVLYSRIKRLTKRSLIKKFTVIVNENMLGINVNATVGINRDPKLKEPIHSELMKIPEVRSLSEVTGRFDMIVSVSAHTLEELHNIVIERVGKIAGIQTTETFVEMQRTEKEPLYTAQQSFSR